MYTTKNLEDFAEGLKEARQAFAKANIDIQSVMQNICDDISIYTDATIVNDRIVIDCREASMYRKILLSISNNVENPAFAFFLFNVVVKGEKVLIIRKNKSDNLV